MTPVHCSRCRQEIPVGTVYARKDGVAEHILCPRDDRYEGQRIIPNPEHEWTAYWVRLSSVGEDGAWLADGHVPPLLMLAAMRKAARDHLGLTDVEVFGDWNADEPLTGLIRHTRAVFTEPDEWADEYPWMVWWGETAQQHRAARDVTVYRP